MAEPITLTQVPGMDAFTTAVTGGFLGGLLGFIVALGILLIVLLCAAVYVYHALAWSAIARSLKHKRPFLAWIPFANFAQILQLGGFHWAWVFLFLIPILGWIALLVLGIISLWRVCDALKYPGWFSLGSLIPNIGPILYLVLIGFLAWDKKSPQKR